MATLTERKNQLDRYKAKFYSPDDDCLRKYNYSNGAGWKTRKTAKIGGVPAEQAFKIRSKKRGVFTR